MLKNAQTGSKGTKRGQVLRKRRFKPVFYFQIRIKVKVRGLNWLCNSYQKSFDLNDFYRKKTIHKIKACHTLTEDDFHDFDQDINRLVEITM